VPRSLVVLAVLGAGAPASISVACSTTAISAVAPGASDDAAAGGGDSGGPGAEASAQVDGAPGGDSATPDTCELTRAYYFACGEELTCGADKFGAWCAQNDSIMNSATYRRAEAMCLTPANCDGTDRRDCEYRTYATATPTAAQRQVVQAYCTTCEPGDVAGCVTRKSTYDPAGGVSSVDDVFVAAWELSDPIVDEIRTKCTGTPPDAGASVTCAKAFSDCAGGVYVDRLPNCP